MNRYSCEYYDGYFFIEEIGDYDSVPFGAYEIFADSIGEAIRQFLDYENI